MLPIQIGLLDQTGNLDRDMLEAAAAAFNLQVQRDLPQFWNVSATVRRIPEPNKIPAGVWPVSIVDSLQANTGNHLVKFNQPYASVGYSADDSWTITASHEILEMLIDPYGSKLYGSRSIEVVDGVIQDGSKEFHYLVELSDPCQADQYAYSIQGIAVSDFITPRFYDPIANSSTRYSFTGAVTAPRQSLPGGYITWLDPLTEQWQQLDYTDPDSPPQIIDLANPTGSNLRRWVDRKTSNKVRKYRKFNSVLTDINQKRRSHMDEAALVRGSGKKTATSGSKKR